MSINSAMQAGVSGLSANSAALAAISQNIANVNTIGYKRTLIVLTQPKDFVKKKNKMLPAIRARYLRYPAFVEAVADRHERYNETLEHVAMLEQTGQAFVIRPPIPLEIGSMERDPAQLRRVYDTGRAVAEIQVDKIAAFVEQSRAAE